MKKNLFIFLIVAPLFGLLLTGGRVYYSIAIWKYEGADTFFQVKPGEGFSKINGRLGREGLISNTRIFHRYAQINGLMTKIKAGNYKIKTGDNLLDVVKILTSGAGITSSVTIPEGKNLYEIAEILEKNDITPKKDFIKLTKSMEFANELGIPAERLEGYLYPDTYRFSKNTPAKDIVKTMVKVFENKTKQLNFSQSDLNKHEIIILASIVEKETGAQIERPRIAGVFYNRLKKRMRMQSDPTTIYGIWERYNGNLRKKDLLEKTPYNTYKISGLPKGPIANPGLKAIKAALNPEGHSFLYFVSKNDGTHVFSKNLKDHNSAVDFWQKNYRNRKGRSWRDLNKKK
ncbi:MAG: endolytic transglycosylase MltG [Bacteriovoracaceae bacterium]|nr:endolytic transglycosylase MltG [Bacteriovoracaceae bacterium]